MGTGQLMIITKATGTTIKLYQHGTSVNPTKFYVLYKELKLL